MSRVIDVSKINTEICTALGIDPRLTASVTIYLSSGPPRVEVTQIFGSETAARLVDALAHYELVAKEGS